jgi:hypothetical protein
VTKKVVGFQCSVAVLCGGALWRCSVAVLCGGARPTGQSVRTGGESPGNLGVRIVKEDFLYWEVGKNVSGGGHTATTTDDSAGSMQRFFAGCP